MLRQYGLVGKQAMPALQTQRRGQVNLIHESIDIQVRILDERLEQTRIFLCCIIVEVTWEK